MQLENCYLYFNFKVPTKLNDCKAKLNNQSTIDLSILDNPRNPR